MLTGNFRHKKTWRGKLVLQLEYESFEDDAYSFERVKAWRNATAQDVLDNQSLISKLKGNFK